MKIPKSIACVQEIVRMRAQLAAAYQRDDADTMTRVSAEIDRQQMLRWEDEIMDKTAI